MSERGAVEREVSSLGVATLGREEVIQERVRRERGRRHLMPFCEYVSPWFRAARHQAVLGEYLELVETYIRTRGKTGIGRLLIEMPPRHGKSEIVSRHFPAWMLGRNPDKRVILSSYGMDLAAANSRSARGILEGDRFKNLFGNNASVGQTVQLSTDSRAVEAWDLASPNRGGVVAAGVGGGITGKGAHLLIVDDPFKNRDEAESETYRQRVWDWYTSSAYTRLEDGGAVVGMLTRWHPDDWAGRLLRAMALDPKADQWVVLWMPAVWEGVGQEINRQGAGSAPALREGSAEGREGLQGSAKGREGSAFALREEEQKRNLLDGVWVGGSDELERRVGEALWPEKYDEGDLERIRANVGEYDWMALYQQMPYMRKGGMFQREWFGIVEMLPKEVTVTSRVRYWDKAASPHRGDYSVGVLLAITSDNGIYVENVVRGQWSSMERERMILETAKLDRERGVVELWHEQEPGSSGVDSAGATNMMLSQAGYTAQFERVTGDKETRAGPWSSACQAGRVRLVRGGWNMQFVEEHVSFPKGRHDDQVDCASGAYAKLASSSLYGGIYV